MLSDSVYGLAIVIHLGADELLVARLKAEADARGMRIVDLHLGGLPDREALRRYLSVAFAFPHETRGLDAAVDLMSDLEWLGKPDGFLVVVRGLTEPSVVSDSFVSLLPNVLDRWRSQAVPFVVAIDGCGDRLRTALSAANRDMAKAGSLPWAQPGTGPVDVVVHGVEGSHQWNGSVRSMSAQTVAAIQTLVDAHRELRPVLDEHLEDNEGEILPHLLMAEVVRWVVANRETHPDVCRSVLAWMEDRFRSGSDEVRGVIAVSGVEMIPDPGEPGSEIRGLLGPSLREVDPWS